MANIKMTKDKYEQMKVLCRFHPTMQDVADYFEVSPKTIERAIKRHDKTTFDEFKRRYLVKTRFALMKKAVDMAKAGDSKMLIHCLKILCKDWGEIDNMEAVDTSEPKVGISVTEVVQMAMQARDEKIETDRKNKERIK